MTNSSGFLLGKKHNHSNIFRIEAEMVKKHLTSYRPIPEGTNSGALAESLEDLIIESS